MKKLFAISLLVMMLFAVCSCNGTDNSSSCVTSEEPNCLRIKIATYNIKNGYDVDHVFSVIAADLKAVDADIVGLQEVDINTGRNEYQDTLAILSEMTDYKYYKFTHCIDFSGGEYGTAILSKYPIESFEVIPLESNGHEARALGHAVINIEGTVFDYFNTHLTLEKDGTRDIQFASIASEFGKCERAALTADFNTETFTDFAPLGDALMVNNSENLFLTYDGKKAIDNIIASSGSVLIESGCEATGHSDHAILWAVIDFPG